MPNSKEHQSCGIHVIHSPYHETFAIRIKSGYLVINNTGFGRSFPFFDAYWKNIVFYQRVFTTENYDGHIQIFNYSYKKVIPNFWSNVLVEEHCIVVEDAFGNSFIYDYAGNLM